MKQLFGLDISSHRSTLLDRWIWLPTPHPSGTACFSLSFLPVFYFHRKLSPCSGAAALCLPLTNHATLTRALVERAKTIYAVTSTHRALLCRAAPSAASKTHTLGEDIPDPWHRSQVPPRRAWTERPHPRPRSLPIISHPLSPPSAGAALARSSAKTNGTRMCTDRAPSPATAPHPPCARSDNDAR